MLAVSSYQQVVNGAEIAARFRFHAWDAAIFRSFPRKPESSRGGQMRRQAL